MEVLRILATGDSPTIYLNSEKNKFEFVGNSMPENSVRFYEPVIDWLKEYLKSPNPETEFTFRMNLINTSSTKIFTDIFKIINVIAEKSKVKILWYYIYGDEDMQEMGVDFKDFSKASFELVPISNFD